MVRKINECFDKQLSTLYKQLLEIEQLNELVKQFLPGTLQSCCRVTHFNQGRLNIGISEAALATELRFFLPTLRDQLRQKAGLYQLTSLNISIITPVTPAKQNKGKVKTPHHLSKVACETITEASKIGDYEPLKQVWKNLAQHAWGDSSNKG